MINPASISQGLSICIITRDQCPKLEKCLNALQKAGAGRQSPASQNPSQSGLLSASGSFRPEIVVLDTGSKDRSKEVAVRYTDNVSDFTWIDDFAAAKNAAIARASFDLVLILDTDEYLEDFPEGYDFLSLVETASSCPNAIGRIKRRNRFTEDGRQMEYDEWINRLFDRRFYHYEGRIHEQVVRIDNTLPQPLSESPSASDQPLPGALADAGRPLAEFPSASALPLPGALADPGRPLSGTGKLTFQTDADGNLTYTTPITIFHDGYDLSPEELKEKARRNILLLQKAIAEEPGDPYLFFQLAKSEYAAGQFAEASDDFSRAMELDPDCHLTYVEDLIETWGYTLLKLSRPGEALTMLLPFRQDPIFANSADYLFLFGHVLMNCAKFEEALDSFIACTNLPPSRTKGTNSFLAYYNAGVICEVAGLPDAAREYYLAAGDYPPAQEGIKRV